MKLILVGIGSFGSGWYKRIKADHPELDVVVVDRDETAQARVTAPDRFYTSLSVAIAQEQPDLIVNATPPGVHTLINHIAFDYRVPVLCEKPMAETYDEARQVVARATREGIPFMIAENYRRFPHCRKVKKLLDEGVIGPLANVHVDFRRRFRTTKAYFSALADPLLVDVAIHHLDLMRYFAGAEGVRLWAQSYNPPGSWCPGHMNACLWLEMTSGITISYNGSMVAQAPETTWTGDWLLEGRDGAIVLADDRITLHRAGQGTPVDDLSDVSRNGPLDDFLAALQTGIAAETWGPDYLHTQALLHAALTSSREGRIVDVP